MNKLFLIFLLFPFFLHAGNNNLPVGGRASGMGNTGLCIADVWAIRFNQAALADLRSVSFGVSYESRFLLKSLGVQSLAVAIPTKRGTFGVNYTGTGDQLYMDSKIGLGYGMKLSEKINLGIRLNYHSLRLGNNYGRTQNITAELSLLAKPTDKIQIGFHLFNPTQTKLNDYQNEEIPAIMNLGVSYKFSEKVRGNVEIEKDIELPFSVKMGVEYFPVDNLYIRAGISTNPSIPTIGFGLVKGEFHLDFSSAFHPALGLTPSLGLRYSL